MDIVQSVARSKNAAIKMPKKKANAGCELVEIVTPVVSDERPFLLLC